MADYNAGYQLHLNNVVTVPVTRDSTICKKSEKKKSLGKREKGNSHFCP